METWPSSLPHEPVSGTFQVLRGMRPRMTTEMEDGPSVSRRSSTKNIATIRFQLLFAPTEFETFKAWARDDLVDGTLAFEMPIWTGSAYANRACHMVGDDPYTASDFGVDQTVVSLTLDVENW